MISRTYIARSCGSREDHGEHFHVIDHQKFVCFGYHAPVASKAQTCWRSECRVTCYYPEACSETPAQDQP